VRLVQLRLQALAQIADSIRDCRLIGVAWRTRRSRFDTVMTKQEGGRGRCCMRCIMTSIRPTLASASC